MISCFALPFPHVCYMAYCTQVIASIMKGWNQNFRFSTVIYLFRNIFSSSVISCVNMILSSTFYALLFVSAVVIVEAMPASESTYSVIIIRINDTTCKIEDGVVSVNGQVIGNLTEEQKEELEAYNVQTQGWFQQLHQKIEELFKTFFGSIKSMWKHSPISGSESSPQSSTPDNIITDKLDDQDRRLKDQGDSENSSLFGLKLPSFCKVN
uniref:Pepsin-I3 domain-containing protein n=1 Tax=Onchocerca volvulus TaxID=6282 RepID=A0A8R1XX36_ONCVO